VRAQGEARSAELIGEAMRNNKGFLQLRRLEAARDIATLLSASGNKVMLDAQSLLLNGRILQQSAILKRCANMPSTVMDDDTKELLKTRK
jgi:prohibitin 2